ncbi:MAG: hypothetical protein HRF45_12055 [Fimbriimonadia bacterium]|jgi:hypothetical protein
MSIRAVALCSIVLLAAGAQAGDRVIITRTHMEGTEQTYVMKGDFELEFTGSTVTIEALLKQTCKGTVKEGDRKDTIAHVLEWTKMDITLDGQAMGDMDRLPPSTRTWLLPDGRLAALTVDGGGPEAEIARLVATVLNVYVPAEGVEIGSTWKMSPTEPKVGAVPGTIEYKMVGVEDVAGAKTAKVRMELKGEPGADGENPVTVSADVWLDQATGTLVKGMATIKSFAIQSLLVNGTVRFDAKPKDRRTPPAAPFSP